VDALSRVRWGGLAGVIGGVLGLGGALRLGPEFLFVLSTVGNFIQVFGFILPASILMLRLQELPVDVPVPEAERPGFAVAGGS
jgi:hypothetical protein